MEGYSKYYQEELYNLRQLSREFAEVHPAMAPMLSGQASDPDVERLLEGTAFLSGLLRRKIDDNLPELIHALTGFVFPHFLKPIPSVTLVRFIPHQGLQETVRVKSGTELGAEPINDVSATFRTCSDCLVMPLRIASVKGGGSPNRGQNISIDFTLTGPGLETWVPERIPLFLGGSYSRAADTFYLLTRKLRRVTVRDGEGREVLALARTACISRRCNGKTVSFPIPATRFPATATCRNIFSCLIHS